MPNAIDLFRQNYRANNNPLNTLNIDPSAFFGENPYADLGLDLVIAFLNTIIDFINEVLGTLGLPLLPNAQTVIGYVSTLLNDLGFGTDIREFSLVAQLVRAFGGQVITGGIKDFEGIFGGLGELAQAPPGLIANYAIDLFDHFYAEIQAALIGIGSLVTVSNLEEFATFLTSVYANAETSIENWSTVLAVTEIDTVADLAATLNTAINDATGAGELISDLFVGLEISTVSALSADLIGIFDGSTLTWLSTLLTAAGTAGLADLGILLGDANTFLADLLIELDVLSMSAAAAALGTISTDVTNIDSFFTQLFTDLSTGSWTAAANLLGGVYTNFTTVLTDIGGSTASALTALVNGAELADGLLTALSIGSVGALVTAVADGSAFYTTLLGDVGSANLGVLSSTIATAVADAQAFATFEADLLSDMSQANLADVAAVIAAGVDAAGGWTTALDDLNLPDPLALIQQIPQSIPALVRDAEGGIEAVGSGITRDADGGISFVADGLTHIVQEADQGLVSLQQISEGFVYAAATIGGPSGTGAAAAVKNPGAADMLNAGQTTHTALAGAIEQAGATVEDDIVAGAAQFGAAVQTAGVNAAGAVVQLEDAAANALGGLAAAATPFGQALGGAIGALLGLFPGGSPAPAATPAQIQDAALAVRTLLANHTADIASLQALLSGGSSGMNVLIPMSGVLPAGFTSMGALAPAGLSAFVNSAVYTAATAPTNAQSVSAIWSANPPTDGYILILNANTALTTYNYLKIYVTSSSGFYWVNFELGSVVSGIQATLDSQTLLLPSRPNPTSIPNNGFTFECDATGLNFDVLYNGSSVFTFNDPGGHVVPGAGQRSFGWATSEASLPGAIIQWGASSPAATIGSGFMATRVATGAATTTAASPSSVTLGSGATFNLVLFSASCFDATPFITSDITYNSPTNTATISVEGWYKVDVSLDIVYSGTGSAGPALFHNGALFKLGPSNIGSSSDTFVLSRSFTVYCAAGDTLTPAALVNGAGFTGPYGETGGVGTYWSVSLMNCGTLS